MAPCIRRGAQALGNLRRCAFAAALAVGLPAMLAGEPDLSTFTVDLGPIDSSFSAEIADLDGNGTMDLVVGNNEDAGFDSRIFLNAGAGSFPSMTEFKLTDAGLVRGLDAADIDGDGHLDLASASLREVVFVAANDGSGGFSDLMWIMAPGRSICSLVCADLDGDTDIDLALGAIQHEVIVYLNNGSGGLAPRGSATRGARGAPVSGTAVPGAVYSLDAADIDNDGDLDVIAGCSSVGPGAQNVVLLNDGQGAFPASLDFGPGDDLSRATAADVNADGWADIAVGNIYTSAQPGEDFVYLNNGAGVFPVNNADPLAVSLNNPGTRTQRPAVADIDGDGALDVIVSDFGGQNVLYLGDGAGAFPTPVLYGTGNEYTQDIAARDLNDDGRADIVLANCGYGSAGVATPAQNVIYFSVEPFTIATGGILPPAADGAAYGPVAIVAQGTGPYSYAVTAGVLPAGIGLDVTTGMLSGAVNAGSSGQAFVFTVAVTDQGASSPAPFNVVSKEFTLFVAPAVTPGLPFATGFEQNQPVPTDGAAGQFARLRFMDGAGAVGDATLVLDAVPGSPAWSLPGGPAGEAAMADPLQWPAICPGHFGCYELHADAGGANALTVSFDWRIDASFSDWYSNLAVVVEDSNGDRCVWGTDATLTSANIGIYQPNGGDTSWNTTVIDVPALSGNAVTISLYWLVKYSLEDDGSYAAGVYVDNLAIVEGVGALPLNILTTPVLPDARENEPYSLTLMVSGGTAPYTWNAPALPAGLTCNAAAGVIEGTPAPGTATTGYVFAVTVQDASAATVTVDMSLTVHPAFEIATTTLPVAQIGTAYSVQLTATGGFGLYSWSAAGLPAGLSCDGSSGLITGTPAGGSAGNYAVTAQVQDMAGDIRTSTLALQVQADAPPPEPEPAPAFAAASGCILGATSNARWVWMVLAALLMCVPVLRRQDGRDAR